MGTFRHPLHFRHQNELMIAAEGMYSGQYIYVGKTAELRVGNILPVGQMKVGTYVCNLEQHPCDRGCLARASGNFCIIDYHNTEVGLTRVRLPSGMKKEISAFCRGTVGLVAGGGR